MILFASLPLQNNVTVYTTICFHAFVLRKLLQISDSFDHLRFMQNFVSFEAVNSPNTLMENRLMVKSLGQDKCVENLSN